MSLHEEGLRTSERHAACTKYLEILGRGGNTQIKETQRIDTGTLHTKESGRELAMVSQAKVTTASGPTTTNPSQTREETAILPGHGSAHFASLLSPNMGCTTRSVVVLSLVLLGLERLETGQDIVMR